MGRFTIYLNGRVSVCPKCSGMLVPVTIWFGYRCIDCGAKYEVVSDDTVSERELICEEVEK